MVVLHRDVDGVACLYSLLYSIEDEDAFALSEGPGLGSVVMYLIRDILACIKGDALGEGMVAVGIDGIVEHSVGAPASLLVHGSWGEVLHGFFNVLGMLFAAHEDAVGTGCHYNVLEPVYVDGVLEFVDDVGVHAMGAHDGIADDVGGELVGEGVPGAKVFPLAVEGYDAYGLGFLGHLVVEGDLGELAVAGSGVFEGIRSDVSADDVHHVAKAEGEDASVPEGSLLEELLGYGYGGLFGESCHGQAIGCWHLAFGCWLWHYISIFFARVGGLDAHEDEFGFVAFYTLYHLADGVEVAGFGVGVAWHDDDYFVVWALLLEAEVAGCQGDGREGVASLGFGDDRDLVAKLVGDDVELAGVGGEGDVAGKAGFTGLSYYSLHHALVRAVFLLKERQELFASGIIAEGPQAFAGASG